MVVRRDNLEDVLTKIRSILEGEFFTFLQVDLTGGRVIDLTISQRMDSPSVEDGYIFFSTGRYAITIYPGTVIVIEGDSVKLNFVSPDNRRVTNWFKVEGGK